jgi:hypothetical protein
MANDRSKKKFNVSALENILVALTREIGDGPCFLYIKFSWIGVMNVPLLNFFNNESQSLPNPEFVSILDKKAIFSKGHPYSISILVS